MKIPTIEDPTFHFRIKLFKDIENNGIIRSSEALLMESYRRFGSISLGLFSAGRLEGRRSIQRVKLCRDIFGVSRSQNNEQCVCALVGMGIVALG